MLTFPRFLLVAILFAGLSTKVAAQHKTQIGLEIGLNTSSVNYTPEANQTDMISSGNRWGFSAGLIGHFELSQHWVLAPSLRYARTGFTISQTSSNTGSSAVSNSYRNRYDLNRIELPIDILYYFNNSQQGVYLLAGVSTGVLLGGKRSYDVTYTDGTQTGSYSDQDNIKVEDTYPLGATNYALKRWDVGVQGGVGYQYHRVAVQADYRIGLINVATNSALNFSSPSTYSRLAEIQIAYFLTK